MELGARFRIALAFIVGLWSLAAQFIFNRIIFFYIANSEYVAASIISIHLTGFWLGTLLARHRRLDVLWLLALTLLVLLSAYVVVWHVGAAVLGLPATVGLSAVFGLTLAGLSGALVVSLMGNDGHDGRGVVIADSAGSVLGALLGGFLMIPHYGLSVSFSAVMAAQAAALVICIILSRPTRLASLCLLIPVMAFAALMWNTPHSTVTDMLVVDGLPIEQKDLTQPQKILYSANTPYGIVTVYEASDLSRFLLIDNRPLCAVSPQQIEELSEWIVAVRPLQMMEFVTRKNLHVANIGLGCGISLSGILSAIGPEGNVDLVEINPGMPEAQKQFWPYQQFNPSDPRVKTTIDDGYRYFAERGTGQTLYDAVVIDLAWMQNMNATHLFSREMYENIARNLQDDGVLGIWSEERNPFSPVSLIIYRTLREVFPHVVIDSSTDVTLFYASKTRADMLNFLDKETLGPNGWIGEIGMSAPVNRLDNLVMNRHKFTLFGDSTWERLFDKYRLVESVPTE